MIYKTMGINLGDINKYKEILKLILTINMEDGKVGM